MAKPLRIEFPGAVYHITSRGNAKQNIYLDEEDKRNFLEVLSLVVERFNWLCHAYCLMENHYHLIIESLEGNLSRGMRQLNDVYTQRFNRRHERIGHLFQGRLKALLVEKEIIF
jgi:REP element-mobilizing transposase RayT